MRTCGFLHQSLGGEFDIGIVDTDVSADVTVRVVSIDIDVLILVTVVVEDGESAGDGELWRAVLGQHTMHVNIHRRVPELLVG